MLKISGNTNYRKGPQEYVGLISIHYEYRAHNWRSFTVMIYGVLRSLTGSSLFSTVEDH